MLLPVSYFGSLAYFSEVVKWSEIEIEAKENFPKQTYRNRCSILGANGIISLTIPVSKPNGSKTTMESIQIVEDGWREIHWRSIRSAYESAPFFDYYGPEIEDLIFQKEKSLLEFDLKILKRIILWLDLPVKLSVTTSFESYATNDLRSSLVHKSSFQDYEKAPYLQVFPGEHSFRKDLSILDAILCEGPMARTLLIPKE